MRKSGVKFGLIGSASSLKKDGGKGRPIGSKPLPRRPPPGATAAFGANSDDEDAPRDDPSGVAAVNKRLAAISAKQEKQAKKDYEEALEADPSVFDYDRVYDGMKDSRESKAAAATVAHEKQKRQPKYIGNLLKQAHMRSVESDRIFERKLQKEREEQDKVEGEATMKFVTSAYKKKLMEQKKWELQQQLEDEREQQNDVTKTGMSGFYSNLITKNIAMGSDVEKAASSAFTAGSKRHTATADYEMQDGNAKPTAPAKSTGSGSGDIGNTHPTKDGNSPDMGGEKAAPTAKMVDPRSSGAATSTEAPSEDAVVSRTSTSTGQEAASDAVSGTTRRREEEEREDGSAGKKRARQGEADGVDTQEGLGDAGSGVGGADPKTPEEEEALQAERKVAEELEKMQNAIAAKAKRESAVKAARERFLARKRAS